MCGENELILQSSITNFQVMFAPFKVPPKAIFLVMSAKVGYLIPKVQRLWWRKAVTTAICTLPVVEADLGRCCTESSDHLSWLMLLKTLPGLN